MIEQGFTVEMRRWKTTIDRTRLADPLIQHYLDLDPYMNWILGIYSSRPTMPGSMDVGRLTHTLKNSMGVADYGDHPVCLEWDEASQLFVVQDVSNGLDDIAFSLFQTGELQVIGGTENSSMIAEPDTRYQRKIMSLEAIRIELERIKRYSDYRIIS